MTAETDDRLGGGDRGLLVGGLVLLSAGGLLCMAGGLAVTAATVRAARTWIGTWEEPPAVVAQRRWGQARSAAAAGARGWQQNGAQLVDKSG